MNKQQKKLALFLIIGLVCGFVIGFLTGLDYYIPKDLNITVSFEEYSKDLMKEMNQNCKALYQLMENGSTNKSYPKS